MHNGQIIYKCRTLIYNLQQPAQEAKPHETFAIIHHPKWIKPGQQLSAPLILASASNLGLTQICSPILSQRM